MKGLDNNRPGKPESPAHNAFVQKHCTSPILKAIPRRTYIYAHLHVHNDTYTHSEHPLYMTHISQTTSTFRTNDTFPCFSIHLQLLLVFHIYLLYVFRTAIVALHTRQNGSYMYPFLALFFLYISLYSTNIGGIKETWEG
ncbi:hypothetical protein VTL71DRAFT_7001 [Oculimacula yallundae]|uniref:Uncharacterized protein n=1 Tax=Oculimacula yallundae TaxID=86028 RepID=A0ABR4BX36_9HELO